jgi:hypothetical protein
MERGGQKTWLQVLQGDPRSFFLSRMLTKKRLPAFPAQ